MLQHILASGQFTRDNLEELLDIARFMKESVKEKGVLDICKDKVSCHVDSKFFVVIINI